jgi:hypothetical protein
MLLPDAVAYPPYLFYLFYLFYLLYLLYLFYLIYPPYLIYLILRGRVLSLKGVTFFPIPIPSFPPFPSLSQGFASNSR